MDLLGDAFVEMFEFFLGRNSDIWAITGRTALICIISTIISSILGISIGFFLALIPFRGRSMFVAFANAGMGMPPVVAGLIVAILLWRTGPLGSLGLMYTPMGMVISQCVIAVPLVAAITTGIVMSLPPAMHLQIRSMGANTLQTVLLLAYEVRLGLLIAIMAGFGAAISEVGAAMMVGGNLASETRVLTTATVQLVSQGEFGKALAYGLMLLILVLFVAITLTSIQSKVRKR
mgnify:CR=1 FL=1